ncbi:glycoside hydrolase family 55 protein [Acidicapsa acidisoli]|uniref:glycoside hydrolase family 55 protein n=1 Tax=Acidicapsa acidisoli TaxID=1615681 RepID=UPI0021E064F6|nr:glycoside hydrolase family 55 protein [Acidicapsa acidisoli]
MKRFVLSLSIIYLFCTVAISQTVVSGPATSVNGTLSAVACGTASTSLAPSWCPKTGTQDIGNWINAACATYKNGGTVIIPAAASPYLFSTPIVINGTCNIEGQSKDGSVLKFTAASGTAITINGASGPNTAGWGIRDLSLLGPGTTGNSNTAIGLQVNIQGFKAKDIAVGGYIPNTSTTAQFHIGLTFGNNSFDDSFDTVAIGTNDINLYYAESLSNSGESISCINCTIANGAQSDGTATGQNCIQILGASGGSSAEFFFFAPRIDGCQVVIGTNPMQVVFEAPHFEDVQSKMDYPFVVINSSNNSDVTMVSPTFFVDASTYTATSLVQLEGNAHLSLPSGATYFGYGGTSQPTIAPFYVSSAGNAQLSLSGIFSGNINGKFPKSVGTNSQSLLYSSDGRNVPIVHIQTPGSSKTIYVPSSGGTFVAAEPPNTTQPNLLLSGEYRLSYIGRNRTDLWDIYVGSGPYAASGELTVLSHYGNAQVITPEILGNAVAGSQTSAQLGVTIANQGGNPGTLTVQWIGDGFSEQNILPENTAAFPHVIPSAPYVASNIPLVQTGTTGSIGGSALAAGACATGTVALATSATGHTAIATESDGSFIGGNFTVRATVSETTATVNVCAVIAGTPKEKTYNVTVF